MGGEEIVIMRNRHPVAKLIPGAPEMRALDAFADLFGIIPDAEGKSWLNDMKTFDRKADKKELADPWGVIIDTGLLFGRIAAELDARGAPSKHRLHDLWIAASAIQHGFQLLTRNGADFADIPGLRLVVI